MTQQVSIQYEKANHNGDNNFVTLSSLEQAVEQIKKNLGADKDAVDIIVDLADYITEHPNREIIGLEKKLKNGKRVDLKDRAVLLKNRFERRVAKNQMSLAEQHVYVQILSAISSIWHSKIKPLIDINTSKTAIDSAIHTELIEPVHKAIVRYDTLATSELVSGMLYFLTGKCHLEWYRLLLILEYSEHERFNTDTYRLIDFYTLFPYLLKLIKPLPKPINNYRNKISDIQEPFESLRNTKRILHELERLQSTAIQNLLAKGLLDKQAFEKGFIQRTQKMLPKEFADQIHSARLPKEEWFKVIVNEFPKAQFTGSKGLKSRTGLMEYRYDMEQV